MEFPDLGQQCARKHCAQLDFLPLECAHCHLVFCKEHHPPSDHECPAIKDNVLTQEEVERLGEDHWQHQCSFPECKVKELVPILCLKCQKHFCLNHRHSDQHSCIPDTKIEEVKHKKSTLDSAKSVQAKVKDEVTSMLNEAKSAGGHKGAMANKLALMRLKGRATGDNTVPQSERVFFIVDCPNKGQNPKPLDLFMSKTWTMGKAVDFLARQARIKNRNNQADAPKLHVFKGDVCISQPFDRTITEIMNSGLLVDGDDISFRYLE